MKLKTPFLGGIAAAALLASCIAVAAPVIDQEATAITYANPFNSDQTGSPMSPFLAQSFQPSGDNVVGGGIYLLDAGGGNTGGEVTLSLWDDLNAAAPLASATATGTVDNWLDVFWASPVTVTPNATYYLVFTSPTGDLGVGYDGDTYTRGVAYIGTDSYADADYAFRTYFIPEPSSLALGGLGLIAAFGATRRRRA